MSTAILSGNNAVHPNGKSFKIVKDITTTGGHGSINKTSSTPTTPSSVPTPNSLPPLASISTQFLRTEYN